MPGSALAKSDTYLFHLPLCLLLHSFPPSYKKRLKAKSHFTPRGYQIQRGFTMLAKITIIWQIEYRSLHWFLSWCLVFSFWIWPGSTGLCLLLLAAVNAVIKLPIIYWVMRSKYTLIGIWLPFYLKIKRSNWKLLYLFIIITHGWQSALKHLLKMTVITIIYELWDLLIALHYFWRPYITVTVAQFIILLNCLSLAFFSTTRLSS